MAWSAPKTWVASEDVDFTEFNTEIRDNFNETAPGIASAAGRLIVTDAVNSIVERIPTTASVATSETTTSVTFTDLSTVGPAVTVGTGTAALVIVRALAINSGASGFTDMGYAVSGATTIGAVTADAFRVQSNAWIGAANVFLETGLTAGSNTFTAKYRVSTGTGTWQTRSITIIPF